MANVLLKFSFIIFARLIAIKFFCKDILWVLVEKCMMILFGSVLLLFLGSEFSNIVINLILRLLCVIVVSSLHVYKVACE